MTKYDFCYHSGSLTEAEATQVQQVLFKLGFTWANNSTSIMFTSEWIYINASDMALAWNGEHDGVRDITTNLLEILRG